MCTVTYLPLPDRGYALTSNRDEQPQRRAGSLTRRTVGREEVFFPPDAGAGGTWIAMGRSGRCVCLLNGALRPHRRQPPYRMSRGLVPLSWFEYADPADFRDGFPFEGLEPFTLLMCDQASLHELRWDGQRVHFAELDPGEPRIWSSVTLYDEAARQRRSAWFETWRTGHPEPTPPAILDFHRSAGGQDPAYRLVMRRSGDLRTTSITQAIRSGRTLSLRYEALQPPVVDTLECDLRREVVG